MNAKPQVLFVEDEDSIRELLSMIVEDAGYIVVQAANVETALRRLSDPSLSLAALITDIKLPDGSGLDVAAVARAKRPKLPVILISGDSEMKDVPLGITRTPKDSFLSKPFTRKMVLDALKLAVGRKTGQPRS